MHGKAKEVIDIFHLMQRRGHKPDFISFSCVLSACSQGCLTEEGEIAARNLFEIELSNLGNYILLSNIYASKAMWDEVDAVRDVMKSKGMKKNHGCSWIEIKNQVHMLLAGDKSHPQMTEILEKLYKLSMEMKKAGYLPNIDWVLQDVDEQDKEQIVIML
ncbi:hypothetical protein REPUB_Repub20aG0097900 [Reevesia pubescens]